jgi:hypothetical protein
MALKDITGNFAASGSNQEYKFQPAASTFGLQLVFDTHPSKVVLYQSLDGESWVAFEVDYGVGKTYQKNIEGILASQYIKIQCNLPPVKALILE